MTWISDIWDFSEKGGCRDYSMNMPWLLVKFHTSHFTCFWMCLDMLVSLLHIFWSSHLIYIPCLIISFSHLVDVCPLLQRFGLEILRYQLWAVVGMSHPSQLPPPGSYVTPESKAGGMSFVRHTTPENIRSFFDPATYRKSDATPDCTQKRPLSPTSQSSVPSKSSRMDRLELLEKFKLAAKLNGVDWNDIVVSC